MASTADNDSTGANVPAISTGAPASIERKLPPTAAKKGTRAIDDNSAAEIKLVSPELYDMIVASRTALHDATVVNAALHREMKTNQTSMKEMMAKMNATMEKLTLASKSPSSTSVAEKRVSFLDQLRATATSPSTADMRSQSVGVATPGSGISADAVRRELSAEPMSDFDIDGSIADPLTANTSATPRDSTVSIGYHQVVTMRHEYDSYVKWVRSLNWRDSRNRREANTIAQAMDAMLQEDIDPSLSTAFEILARRYAGIVLMNEGKSAEIASQLEYRDHARGVVPKSMLFEAMRAAAIDKRVNTQAKPSTAGRKVKPKSTPSKKASGTPVRAAASAQ
jgi:hypothetical protein